MGVDLGGDTSGSRVRGHHGHQHARGHDAAHVAGRPDHRARHRQRHLAHHHHRHRRTPARRLDPGVAHVRAGQRRAGHAKPARPGGDGGVFRRSVIAAIIAITQAQRKISVQYARRIVGRKEYRGGTQTLPLKLNYAGVMPIIFGQSLLMFPARPSSTCSLKTRAPRRRSPRA